MVYSNSVCGFSACPNCSINREGRMSFSCFISLQILIHRTFDMAMPLALILVVRSAAPQSCLVGPLLANEFQGLGRYSQAKSRRDQHSKLQATSFITGLRMVPEAADLLRLSQPTLDEASGQIVRVLMANVYQVEERCLMEKKYGRSHRH